MHQILESIEVALRAIWASKLRSFLTVLGNIVDEVRAATTLKPRDKEPIPLVDLGLLRDEDQSIRVMFMFPRTAPITLADRDVEFVTKLGSVTEIKKRFRLRDMQVGDRLAL